MIHLKPFLEPESFRGSCLIRLLSTPSLHKQIQISIQRAVFASKHIILLLDVYDDKISTQDKYRKYLLVSLDRSNVSSLEQDDFTLSSRSGRNNSTILQQIKHHGLVLATLHSRIVSLQLSTSWALQKELLVLVDQNGSSSGWTFHDEHRDPLTGWKLAFSFNAVHHDQIQRCLVTQREAPESQHNFRCLERRKVVASAFFDYQESIFVWLEQPGATDISFAVSATTHSTSVPIRPSSVPLYSCDHHRHLSLNSRSTADMIKFLSLQPVRTESSLGSLTISDAITVATDNLILGMHSTRYQINRTSDSFLVSWFVSYNKVDSSCDLSAPTYGDSASGSGPGFSSDGIDKVVLISRYNFATGRTTRLGIYNPQWISAAERALAERMSLTSGCSSSNGIDVPVPGSPLLMRGVRLSDEAGASAGPVETASLYLLMGSVMLIDGCW